MVESVLYSYVQLLTTHGQSSPSLLCVEANLRLVFVYVCVSFLNFSFK